MFTPKTALFTFVAACAIGVVACQPTDEIAEHANRALDETAAQLAIEAKAFDSDAKTSR